MDCGRFRQMIFQYQADTIALVHLDCGARDEPLKPQQSIVFQGAIFRFTGSAVSWNTLTPLSIMKDRA
jgi:hypothetical protein